jgi:hypothetical protein
MGIYRTGEILDNPNKGSNTLESQQQLYDKFDPKKL